HTTLSRDWSSDVALPISVVEERTYGFEDGGLVPLFQVNSAFAAARIVGLLEREPEHLVILPRLRAGSDATELLLLHDAAELILRSEERRGGRGSRVQANT